MQVQSTQDNGGTLPDPVPKPSALRVATLRAAHQLLDAPLVFDRPVNVWQKLTKFSVLSSLANSADRAQQEGVKGDG